MKKVVLLFPGQGSQYIGMGRWLYDQYEEAREIFTRADEALNMNLSQMCFRGEIEKLSRTINTQPALFTVAAAAWSVLEKQNEIEVVCAAGHSLGEYSALYAAGAIEFEEAVRLVRLRGRLMQETDAGEIGIMSAVNGVKPEVVQAVVRDISNEHSVVEISNYNSPVQTVIAGHIVAVKLAEEKLSQQNARIVRLKVSAPFHCSLMERAALELEEALNQVQYHECRIPVISNVTAAPYTSRERIGKLLKEQMIRPVEWTKSMQFISSMGGDMAIDMGPGEIVKSLWKRNCPNLKVYSLEKEKDRILL